MESQRQTRTVSVVIPTYNQPVYLTETLKSVFGQTYGDFEVVVVDDGSTDATPEVLAKLGEMYGPKLRVIRQANGGIGAARNRGIAEATGHYVALLDHDDLWLPEKLAVQVAFMEHHPTCVASVVPFTHFADGDALSIDRPSFEVAAVADPDGMVRRPLRRLAQNHAFMTTSSILMFVREKAAGLRYGTTRGSVEDVPFYIKLMARGDFGVAGRQVLVGYRTHPSSGSAKPEYFYRGIRQLRSQYREGRFDEYRGSDRVDLTEYLAYLGRLSTLNQFLMGARARGVELYFREFVYQARLRRLRFLALVPVLAILPQRTAKRTWARISGSGDR